MKRIDRLPAVVVGPVVKRGAAAAKLRADQWQPIDQLLTLMQYGGSGWYQTAQYGRTWRQTLIDSAIRQIGY